MPLSQALLELVGEIESRSDSQEFTTVQSNMDAPIMPGLPAELTKVTIPGVDREEFQEYVWANKLVPAADVTAPGADSIEQVRATYVGAWEQMKDYGTNPPRSDVNFQTISYGNKRFWTSYGISDRERDRQKLIANGNSAIQILAEKKFATRESYEQLRNKMFSFGNPRLGIYGAANHPDVPRSQGVFRPGLDQAADDNLNYLIRVEARIGRRTKQVERPNTIVFPPDIMRELKQQPYVLAGGTSLTKNTLAQFLENSVSVKNAEMAPELEGAGPSGEDVILIYTRDPKKLCSIEPMKYRESPSERHLAQQLTIAQAEISGVHYKRPLSAEILLVPAM